jgi:hypothetical protein
VDRYGVRQRVTKTYESQRTDGAVSKRRSDRPQVKELPGISPLVLPRHLLDACLFLELADVAPGLPPYREEVRTIPLGSILGPVYHHLEHTATAALHQLLARYDTHALASWFTGLMVQPNLPWHGVTIAHPRTGYVLGEAPPLPEELVYPKEQALLELLRQERSEGRRCLVYVEHTGEYDLLTRLERLIKEDDTRWRAGLPVQTPDEDTAPPLPLVVPRPSHQPAVQVRVLRSSTVQSTEREAWLEQTVEAGCDVLLCHSGLVEVGLDLLAFPTIVCYETIFSTTRLRQATRRSYRPGQTLPVRVFQLVYQKSMEARGLLLIAQKIASSLMVEGKLPGGESLATQALGSQGTNPLLDLARSVLQDAEGQHREVAGSLEAAFAVMQEAERTQDAYVGGEVLLAALTTLPVEASAVNASQGEEASAVVGLLPAAPPEAMPLEETEALLPLFQPDMVTPATGSQEADQPATAVSPVTTPPRFGVHRTGGGSRAPRHQAPPAAPRGTLWDRLEGEEAGVVLDAPASSLSESEATLAVPTSEVTAQVSSEAVKEETSLLNAEDTAAPKVQSASPTPATASLPASDQDAASPEVASLPVPTQPVQPLAPAPATA